jgi:hypothetical protein
MTIALDLTPDMENRLNDEAARLGMPPEQYVLDTLRSRLSRPWPPRIPEREGALLEIINQGFTDEFWNRLRDLKRKLRSETISLDEQEELIGYADQIEEYAARRLAALVELAAIRNTTPRQLMKQLGIEPPKYE